MKKNKSEPSEEHIHVEKKEFPRKAIAALKHPDGSIQLVEIEFDPVTKETGQMTFVNLNPNTMIARDEFRVKAVSHNKELFG